MMKKINIFILSLLLFANICAGVGVYAEHKAPDHGVKIEEHGAKSMEHGEETKDEKEHMEVHEPGAMSQEPSSHGEAVHEGGEAVAAEGHGEHHAPELKGYVTPEISDVARLPIFAILIPIFGAFLVLLVGKKNRVRQAVTVITAVANFIVLLMMVGPVINGIVVNGELYKGILFKIDYFYTYSLSFKVDPISLLIALTANFLWMMSVTYAIGYMSHEHAKTRYDFFVLLSLAMNLGVLLAGDLLTLFMFFEGLLLAPYPLVMHEEDAKSKAAAKTYLYMGVATGLCLLMGIFLLNYFTGSLDIAPVGEKLLSLGTWKYVIAGLMIIGFGGKAGLFFEHIWLPQAHPVAPSPASALLSGSMIKCGAYGIIRVVNMFYLPVLENANNWLTMNNIGYIMIWVGVLTMFLGVLNALISANSKQMLAFHSVSQMGYIIMGVGCAAYLGKDGAMGLSGAVYHIVNHAIFKASLFMCVGAVYYRTHELDMYKLGGLWRNMPVTAVCLFIAVCGIAGIPGFNGFASKTLLHHSIVEAYEHSVHYLGKPDPMLRLAEIIFMLTAGGTFASNIKLFVLTFMGKRREEHAEVKEVPWPMRIGLIGFSCAILLIGFFPNFLLEHMIGPGLSYFGFDPASHPYHLIYNIHTEGLHSTLPILYEPVTKALFSSKEVLHNLGGCGAAVLLGGTYFVLGLNFGWFHVHVPEYLTVSYYYRKIFAGFKYFCMKPCLVFSVWVRELISALMVYVWVPGSHEGIYIKRKSLKTRGWELFSDADTKLNLLHDENLKKQPGVLEMLDRGDSTYGGPTGKDRRSGTWGMFGRADTSYDHLLGDAIQKQGGVWKMFGNTDIAYDTILDRVIAGIIGVEEIPISVIEEAEVLEKLPGEGLVAGYYKFCDANKSVDMNVIDGFVNLLANLTKWLGSVIRKLQTGKVSSYAYSFVFGAVVIMMIFLLK